MILQPIKNFLLRAPQDCYVNSDAFSWNQAIFSDNIDYRIDSTRVEPFTPKNGNNYTCLRRALMRPFRKKMGRRRKRRRRRRIDRGSQLERKRLNAANEHIPNNKFVPNNNASECIKWMNKWVNEWVNEWMNEWMNWINEWMNECRSTGSLIFYGPRDSLWAGFLAVIAVVVNALGVMRVGASQ